MRIIPYIIYGKENSDLTQEDLEICRHSITLMQEECVNDRLAINYSKWLKLERMAMYCLVLDGKNPVMFSGAQHTSENTCRLFSRYYLFNAYRTDPSKNLYDKVDNFETDLFMLDYLKNRYKLFFWSRDKGTSFFKRIKNNKPNIFGDWTVHDQPVEILWKNNIQGIFYKGDISYINELAVNE